MADGYTKQELYDFIVEAGNATYAGGGQEVETPQRPGHTEYRYTRPPFSYVDSYAGWMRSQGSEYVIHTQSGKVIWENGYGGGMVEGFEHLANQCFGFLKVAMQQKDTEIQSFRGPKFFEKDEWTYTYVQNGDIERYTGREEIFYNGELVFFHDVNGGIVREG